MDILEKIDFTGIEFWAFIIVVNIVAFFMYGFDKQRAERGGWRVPEASLHMASLIGGSIGAYLGMKNFRHKTKKGSFKVIYWLIVMIQIFFVFLKITGLKL